MAITEILKKCNFCGKPFTVKGKGGTTIRQCSMKCYIQINSVPEPNTGCWLWLGTCRGGYGRSHRGGKQSEAHRISYEAFLGEIEVGLEVDHLCRVRCCVNPNHLQAVTPLENVRRSVPFRQKHHSAEHCAAISESEKRRYENPEERAAQAMRLEEARKSHKRIDNLRIALKSEEYRQQKSDAMRELWKLRKAGKAPKPLRRR